MRARSSPREFYNPTAEVKCLLKGLSLKFMLYFLKSICFFSITDCRAPVSMHVPSKIRFLLLRYGKRIVFVRILISAIFFSLLFLKFKDPSGGTLVINRKSES